MWRAGDVILLDTTKELIHSALLSPTAAGSLANGEALDKQADDEFSDEVSAAIVDWIAKRMSDYHKNFHDTQLMQVSNSSWSCCDLGYSLMRLGWNSVPQLGILLAQLLQ